MEIKSEYHMSPPTMLSLDSFLAEQRASLEEDWRKKYFALVDDVVSLLDALTKIWEL